MPKDDCDVIEVLVVEDEPVISQLVERVLTNTNTRVTVAADGRIAQEVLQSKQFDVCLIDMRTPAMNGRELYEWIEKNRPYLLSRIIFTTGDTMSNNIENFLDSAGKPFLPKPFTPGQLKSIVASVIKKLPEG